MPTPDEAARALRTVARLAEEQGDALDRAFRLFGDGALLGPRAARLHAGLVDRYTEVGQAFNRAFRQVEHLVTAHGEPARVPAPRPRRPPVPLREPPGGFVGGDPDLMQVIDAELAEVAGSWQRAGEALSTTLARLGLDAAPGHNVARAGGWLADQRPDLRRRRAELLKTPPPPRPEPPPSSPFDTVAEAVADAAAGIGATWAGHVAGVASFAGLPAAGELARDYAEHVAVPLVQGAAEAVAGAARFGWEHSIGGLLTDPSGMTDRLHGAYAAGEFAAEHPVEFAKEVAGWETLTEDPARWFGRLLPDLLVGGGVATRTGRIVDAAATGPRLPGGSPIPPPRTAADGPPLNTIRMDRRFEGETIWGVQYLDPGSLEATRLVVHEGRLYDVRGRPYSTDGGTSHWAPDDERAIFVMDRYGNLYASTHHEVGVFHHSSFLRGRQVAGAGDLRVRDGVLELISRHSGHYRPDAGDLDRVIDVLRRAGIDFRDVRREDYRDD